MTVVLLTASNAIAADVSSVNKLNTENNPVVVKDRYDAYPPKTSEISKLENHSIVLADLQATSSVVDEIKETTSAKPFSVQIDIIKPSFDANYSDRTTLEAMNNEINSGISTDQSSRIDSLTDGETRAVPVSLSITPRIEITSLDSTFLNVEYDARHQINNFVDSQNNSLTNNNQLTAQTPIVAEVTSANKRNYVGFTVGSILNIPTYGVNAKFEVINNISVRPFIQYAKLPRFVANLDGGSGNVDVSGFLYGLSATYDFNIPRSELSPYAGIGLASASGTANIPSSTPSSTTVTTSPVYVELGADYNFTDSIVFNLNYKFQDFGILSFGAGYRF